MNLAHMCPGAIPYICRIRFQVHGEIRTASFVAFVSASAVSHTDDSRPNSILFAKMTSRSNLSFTTRGRGRADLQEKEITKSRTTVLLFSNVFMYLVN
jgi:hypothetical protein